MYLKTLLFSSVVVFFFSCESDNPSPSKKKKKVDPSDAPALSRALTIENSQRKSGTVPATNTSMEVALSYNQSSAEITVDNKFYLPLVYNYSGSDVNSRPSGLYVQVVGSDDYFQIANISATTNTGTLVIPIQLPDNVLRGQFELSYCVYDALGRVSNILSTDVTVQDSLSGCGGLKEGSSGLTITSYDLGDKAGTATLNYDVFNIQDRIDVFYDGRWVAGTGSSLSTGVFPPIYVQYTSPLTEGYVSGTGTLTFPYSPSTSRKVDVYVSGALGGQTLWETRFDCIP